MNQLRGIPMQQTETPILGMAEQARVDQESDPPDVSAIVGMTTEEATKHLETFGYKLRITSRDGHPCIVSMDYRTDRVNVGVVGGIVKSVRGFG
jgi:hypothetical protein